MTPEQIAALVKAAKPGEFIALATDSVAIGDRG